MLMNDSQIDRSVARRRWYLLVGFILMLLPIWLPNGWKAGFSTGFSLFSLGLYGLVFRRWREEPGLWMLAVFLTVLLGSCWLGLEYEWFKKKFLEPVPAGNPAARVDNRDQILWALDTTIAFALFTQVIRFNASIVVANRRHTRGQRVPFVPAVRCEMRNGVVAAIQTQPATSAGPTVPATPQQGKQTPVSLIRFILNTWCDLFRGRDTLLIRHYRTAAQLNGIALTELDSVMDARKQFYAAMSDAQQPNDAKLDAIERKAVIIQRANSGWVALWSTIIPVVIVSWQLNRMPPLIANANWWRVALEVAKRSLLAGLGFIGLSVLGRAVQGLILRLVLRRGVRGLPPTERAA
jgi:hypothetical protein